MAIGLSGPKCHFNVTVFRGMRFEMCKAILWTGFACWAIAFTLSVPFVIAGSWLESRADDLEGSWRRGREQNWLWHWSRRDHCEWAVNGKQHWDEKTGMWIDEPIADSSGPIRKED